MIVRTTWAHELAGINSKFAEFEKLRFEFPNFSIIFCIDDTIYNTYE